MSETDFDRLPVELLEIRFPKCANTYGVSPCTATGSGDAKCYNCRATCTDVENYRDIPDRHLDADQAYATGEEIDSADLTLDFSIFASFDVRFGSSPDGVIWTQGDDTDDAAYLGVTSDELIFRAGASDVASGANTGRIAVDAIQFAGMSLTLYVEIKFVASGTCTLNLWAYDPVELTNTLLGTDTFTDSSGDWAGTAAGSIGEAVNSVATGESAEDWEGFVTAAYFYDSQEAPSDMGDNFFRELWLGFGREGEPTGEKYILPCLTNVSSLGARLNINASEESYEALGRRATLDFTALDFNHSDISTDPYLSDREHDPASQGTFWRKQLAREKFGKVSALTRSHIGYADQPLSDYITRTYVLDSISYTEDAVSGSCRDILTKTEFSKAQVPVLSTGSLYEDIEEDGTVDYFRVTGDVTDEYPTSGTVRINDEIMTYTGLTYDSDYTEFTGVSRATDGSEIASHEIDDLVQICRRYTKQALDDVVIGLLVDDASIPGQLINITGIEDEHEMYLSAYQLTTLITEPTSVKSLIGTLSEECGFYIFWDERSQYIDLQAIRAVSEADLSFAWSHEENIIAGSVSIEEKPTQRLNVINFYYTPLSWTEDLDDPTNFKNGLGVANGETSLPEQYGNTLQLREVFSRWLQTEAEANQVSSRLALRYGDIPQYLTLYVDAKDRSVWIGDRGTISHPAVADAQGNRLINKRWLVIDAEEVSAGDIMKYILVDITLDGIIYYITENSVTTYTPELFAAGNAFITDNDGLNSDGTTGATIS